MTAALKSVDFRRSRERAWLELEGLVQRIEKKGLRSLTAGQASRLPTLYRAAVSSLSVARAISVDRSVLEYLEHLCGRAYFAVYGARRPWHEPVFEFLGSRFPRLVRRYRWPIALAFAFLALGVVTGFGLTLQEPDLYYSLVPTALADDRGPMSTSEELRHALYAGADSGNDELTAFSTLLFAHNAQIGILAFALGFALGLPTFLLLFSNGLMLGAFAALYHSRGLSAELWAWLLPHGVTELTAVAFAGGGGLVLARSVIQAGRLTRLESLARHGRSAAMLIVGCVLMDLVAALFEGYFRQLVTEVGTRYAVAGIVALLWLSYFTLAGRRAAG